jgi:RNA polymerase sigma-70 factor, ECF subfamily
MKTDQVPRLTASELLEGCLAADPDALTQLYDDHVGDVLRLLRGLRLGLSSDRLEDVVQETFLRLLDQLPKLGDAVRLRPFLLGIARHVAIDEVRRAARDGHAQERTERVEAPSETPPATVAREEQREIVATALAALPAEMRSVIGLRHLSGLTMSQLAVALSCSVPTARARLREAASRLATELRRRGLDPSEVNRDR